jgi:hypothetical protein
VEGKFVLRGAGEVARAHGLLDAESRWRTLATFFAQWDDPRDGLALAREGQVRAEQVGSRYLAMQMVGNGVQCALRTGEWDWAVDLLQEWIEAPDPSPGSDIEFATDRAIFDALRGEDTSARIASVETQIAEVTDPQFRSYRDQAEGWAALAAGRLTDAQASAHAAFETTSYFAALTLPIAARAALWSGDSTGVRAALEALLGSGYRGGAVRADLTTIRAGLAALEGRGAEALGGYREALRAWQALGLAWDEALCGLDMATVLEPSDPEVAVAVERARATLMGLRATPILERLPSAPRVTDAPLVGS